MSERNKYIYSLPPILNPFEDRRHEDDLWSYNLRHTTLSAIMGDLGDTTNEAFSMTDFKSANRVLELGMGRGMAGKIIREQNPEVYLYGADNTEYLDRNQYSFYDQRDAADITEVAFWMGLREQEPFDVIVAIGLPSHVNTMLILSELIPEFLTTQGKGIIIADIPLYCEQSLWAEYSGTKIIDGHTFIFDKQT